MYRGIKIINKKIKITETKFDISKVKTSKNLKSNMLAEELLKYPDANVFICGDNEVWFHVTEDEKCICLDMTSLNSDCYSNKLEENQRH